MTEIRTAVPEDLPRIMEIYRSAQEYMIKNGNPDQWRRVYPSEARVSLDIERGFCRVLVADGVIRAAAAICAGEDPSYRDIKDGKWFREGEYVAIHRVASDGSLRGVFRAFSDLAKSISPDVRVDTHRDNRIMQEKIEEEGFVRCGTVFAEDGTPRIAYQWVRE